MSLSLTPNLQWIIRDKAEKHKNFAPLKNTLHSVRGFRKTPRVCVMVRTEAFLFGEDASDGKGGGMAMPPRRGVRSWHMDAAPHGTTGFTRMPAVIPPLAWMPLSQGAVTLSEAGVRCKR